MALFQKQIMQAKDMFLKNNYFKFFIFIILFYTVKLHANDLVLEKSINYLKKLKYFSASFIQSNNNEISEGKLYIGKKRVRVEYNTPAKILIILDKDKAMYYNYELEEEEFFNPQNTQAWFFFDIFNNPFFFNSAKLTTNNNNIVLEKNGKNEDGEYNIKVFFENNPLLIRKIELYLNDTILIISIFNHNYDVQFNEKYFKLINPDFFN